MHRAGRPRCRGSGAHQKPWMRTWRKSTSATPSCMVKPDCAPAAPRASRTRAERASSAPGQPHSMHRHRAASHVRAPACLDVYEVHGQALSCHIVHSRKKTSERICKRVHIRGATTTRGTEEAKGGTSAPYTRTRPSSRTDAATVPVIGPATASTACACNKIASSNARLPAAALHGHCSPCAARWPVKHTAPVQMCLWV